MYSLEKRTPARSVCVNPSATRRCLTRSPSSIFGRWRSVAETAWVSEWTCGISTPSDARRLPKWLQSPVRVLANHLSGEYPDARGRREQLISAAFCRELGLQALCATFGVQRSLD